MAAVVVDLFAGPGGWDEGVRHLGIRPVGIELDDAACATGRSAGHRREQTDVTRTGPTTYAAVEGIIASPPCQGFSTAGKGEGRRDTDLLLRHIPFMAAHNVDAAITWLHTHMHDDRSVLALEPLRWALQLRPTWTVWEQVPAVLPLWEACAAVLRREGWSVVTGNVQAEQYGVPQTRRRAVLLARRDGVPATLPTPTHSRYHTRTPGRLDPGVRPWISMAKALGWGTAELVGFPRRWDGRGEELQLDGQAYRARDMRHTEMPARTLTEKTRSWTRWEADGQLALAWGFAGAGPTAERTAGQRPRELDTPAHTITGAGTAYWLVNHRERVRAEVAPRVNNQSGTEFDLAWPADRPAPVVAGREIVTMPGANANRYNGASKSRNDGVRVSVAEAAVLQTFPVDYPWQGTKTAQFRQVGDAVPPYLAYHLVREVTS